jgi:hypothetical protein
MRLQSELLSISVRCINIRSLIPNVTESVLAVIFASQHENYY